MIQGLESKGSSLEGIFEGPPVIGRALPVLRRLPGGLATGLLAWSALLDGLFRRGRFRLAWRWAGAQGRRGFAQGRLATALLLNHGRFVAQEALIGVGSSDEFRTRSRVSGLERLSGLTSGAIILGLHIGPPRSWLALRAHGAPVCFAIRENAGRGEQWNEWIRDGVVVPLPFGDPQGRLQALYRLRSLLESGKCVFLTADGPMGRELCRLELPGTSVIIRNGWFSLRRQLKVPVFPISICENDRRLDVTLHPPLPDVVDDQAADRDACRMALTGIFADYVRRHPEQCRYLAFPPWES